MPGKHGLAHSCEATAAQVEETHAVARREAADRKLVNAEAALRSTARRAADEPALRIAPPEEPAARNRLRIERAATREPGLQLELSDVVTGRGEEHRERRRLAVVVEHLAD